MELGLASESLRLRLNRPSPPPRLSPPVSERLVAVVFARASPQARTPAPLLLVCRVTGFYPRPVRVAWLQDGEEVGPGGRLSSSGILPNADLTYQLRSSLAVEPGDGHSYACRVEHSSLGGQSLPIPWVHEGLTVLQSPAVLRASPGETVNLSCSFENRPGSAVNVRWTRAPGVILESHHPFYKGRFKVFFRDLLQKEEVTLTLSDLEKRDSGLYQCHISIRQGESGTGAGTELQVMGRNQSDTGKEPAPVGCCGRELLYQVAIALGLLLILGLVATLLLKRRRAPPPSQPRQRQPKGHGSRGAEESESVQYAEIKIQTPGRREHTSNHAQRR
ncbi:unnamed protein product [Caretta caretta]